MKTIKLIIAFMAVWAITSIPTGALANSEANSQDSLKIIRYESGYIIYSPAEKMELKNDTLRIKIRGYLSYIASTIPEEFWVKAYVNENFIYKKTLTNPTRLEIKNWQPKIFVNCWESRAMLLNRQLLSVSYCYETESKIEGMSSGVFFVCVLFWLGIFVGLTNLIPVRGNYYSVPASLAIILALAGYFLFGKSLTALFLPVGSFLLGVLLVLAIIWINKKLFKKTPKD